VSDKFRISKCSDHSSARVDLGSGYVEIELGPDHRRVVVYSKDLARISKAHLRILLNDVRLYARNFFERYACRRKWVSMRYFELASLANSYMRALAAVDRQGSLDSLDMLRKRIERVLKFYKLSVFRAYKKIPFGFEPPELRMHLLSQAGTILHRELKVLSALHRRHVKFITVLEDLGIIRR
jgi:hypothetical protein